MLILILHIEYQNKIQEITLLYCPKCLYEYSANVFICVRCGSELIEDEQSPFKSSLFKVLAISASGFLGLVIGGTFSDLIGQHIIGYTGLAAGIIIGTRILSKDKWYLGVISLVVLLGSITIIGLIALIMSSLSEF